MSLVSLKMSLNHIEMCIINDIISIYDKILFEGIPIT